MTDPSADIYTSWGPKRIAYSIERGVSGKLLAMRALAVQVANDAQGLDPGDAMVDVTQILASIQDMIETIAEGWELLDRDSTKTATFELVDGLDEAIAAAQSISNNL